MISEIFEAIYSIDSLSVVINTNIAHVNTVSLYSEQLVEYHRA